MADEDLDTSLSRDSFPPDGQAQSGAAKAQQGLSQDPKTITVNISRQLVQDPFLDKGAQHKKEKKPSKKKQDISEEEMEVERVSGKWPPSAQTIKSHQTSKSKPQKSSEPPPAPLQTTKSKPQKSSEPPPAP